MFSSNSLAVIRRNVLYNWNTHWGGRYINLVVNPLVKLLCVLELQIVGQVPSNVFAILGIDNTSVIIYMLLFIRFIRKDTKPDYVNATGYFSWSQLLLKKNGNAEHNLFPGK